MIGKKYGQWEVIKREKNSLDRRRQWLCKCSCGFEKIFSTTYLNSGKVTCCDICKEKNRIKIENSIITKYLNKKVGDYTVIKYLGKNKYQSRQWLCRCKCGNERVFRTSMISGNGIVKATQCKKCYNESLEIENRVTDNIPNRFWYKLLNVAERRKIEVNVTKNYLYNLYKKQNKKCALTGVDLYFTNLRTNYNRYTNASLDRINSSKGYVKDNIQWVEKRVNMMKQQYSQDEFIEVCKKVANNH